MKSGKRVHHDSLGKIPDSVKRMYSNRLWFSKIYPGFSSQPTAPVVHKNDLIYSGKTTQIQKGPFKSNSLERMVNGPLTRRMLLR